MELTPAQQFAHITIRIECDLSSGQISTGTGFFYQLDKTDQDSIPVIVTNNHVIEGTSKGRFLFTLKNQTGNPEIGKFEKFEFNEFEKLWKPHPNKDIDLCVFPVAKIAVEVHKRNTDIFYMMISNNLIPTESDIDDMLGLDGVTMVGYPNGLWDQVNNLPIFRKGVLATDYKYDWNGRKEFLIDAACFPGSSGSPVLLLDVGSYSSRKGSVMGKNRIKLLGILYAGPQHTVEGEIKVVVVPTQHKAISLAGIPNNLGIVIKSQELLAFEGMLSSEFRLSN